MDGEGPGAQRLHSSIWLLAHSAASPLVLMLTERGKVTFFTFLLNNSVVLGVMRNFRLLRKECCVNSLVPSASADSLGVSVDPFGNLFKSFAVGRVL